MTCGVYKISFSNTNKVYIGSSKNIESRFKTHLYQLNKGCHHSYKLQRYYNDNKGLLKFEIIQECQEDDRTIVEGELINKYNSIKDGFNVSPVVNITVDPKDKMIEEHDLDVICLDLKLFKHPYNFNHSVAFIEAYMRGKYNYCLDNNISYSETIESIAKNMNTSMATVKTAINELSSSGILKVIKDRSAYNKNTYVFLTEGVAQERC